MAGEVEKTEKRMPAVASVISLPVKQTVANLQEAAATGVRPQTLRRRWLSISFVFGFIIPVILGSVYFAVIASDRYAASAGFSVRSVDSTAVGGDLLGAITGLSSNGSTTTDSFIILEYLQSRELVEKLIQDAEFLKAYSGDDVDFLYRLDTSMPIEDIVEYWQWMISTSYDNGSSIITFEVEAFSPEDAEKIAALILQYCQELINQISQKARQDVVQFAEKEVASAELRLKLVRARLRDFRAKSNALDPSATATAQIELITGLERQLIELRTRLASLRSSVSESSPAIKQLKTQIESFNSQLEEKKREIGGDARLNNEENLSDVLANFERLGVEQEFAQQAYTVALSSLERARAEADRQQRFLAVFKNPSVPQDAIYPKRFINIFLVIFSAFIVWGLGVLLVYSIRDHLR